MYKYGPKPQPYLTPLISGTNLDIWFYPRKAQNFVSSYVTYIELNILSSTLFFLTLKQKASLSKDLNVFAKLAKHQSAPSLFILKNFSTFFNLKNFPNIVLRLKSPSEKG
jgi:hypothetical protein